MKMKSTVILRPRELQNAVVLLVERDVAPLLVPDDLGGGGLGVELEDVVSHPGPLAAAARADVSRI